jgi:hypothetical protein
MARQALITGRVEKMRAPRRISIQGERSETHELALLFASGKCAPSFSIASQACQRYSEGTWAGVMAGLSDLPDEMDCRPTRRSNRALRSCLMQHEVGQGSQDYAHEQIGTSFGTTWLVGIALKY